MSIVHDLRPMDLEEARAFLEAKGYRHDIENLQLTELFHSMPRPEQMLLRRALLTVSAADLLKAQAEISAAATVSRMLRL